MKFGMKMWIPLICIVVIIISGAFLFMHKLKAKVDETEMNKNEELNSSEDEKEVEEENITNNEEEKQTQVSSRNTTPIKENTITSNKGTYTAGATDDKEKAIELVKAEYGGSDSFNFVFDYINEDGEFIVAVKEKETAEVKQYFRVNLEDGTVEPD